jgi:uracil-DNA glycosylase
VSAGPGLRGRYLEALGIDVWVTRADRPFVRGGLSRVVDPGQAPASQAPASQAAARQQAAVPPSSTPAAPETPLPPGMPPVPSTPPTLVNLALAMGPGGGSAASAVGSPDGSADDWSGLQAEVLACTRCALHRGRTQAVFASGDRTARWMVVGEAPGADEDRQGEPFVGRAGQLLNAMLAAIGLPRPAVFVANMVKCRPPQNRDPKPEELAACRPYLERRKPPGAAPSRSSRIPTRARPRSPRSCCCSAARSSWPAR